MDELWVALEDWFSQHLPEVLAALNPGCSNEELEELEGRLACSLPEDFKSFYRRHNGQTGNATGIFFGLDFLSTTEIYNRWSGWRDLAEDFTREAEETGEENYATRIEGYSYPVNAIKPIYINVKWISFSHDWGGNHLGIDLDPGPAGTVGQVINFGRDQKDKYVLAPSFRIFIAWIVEQLQAGNYDIEFYSDMEPGYHALSLKEPSNCNFLDVLPLLFDPY